MAILTFMMTVVFVVVFFGLFCKTSYFNIQKFREIYSYLLRLEFLLSLVYVNIFRTRFIIYWAVKRITFCAWLLAPSVLCGAQQRRSGNIECLSSVRRTLGIAPPFWAAILWLTWNQMKGHLTFDRYAVKGRRFAAACLSKTALILLTSMADACSTIYCWQCVQCKWLCSSRHALRIIFKTASVTSVHETLQGDMNICRPVMWRALSNENTSFYYEV